MLKMEDWTIHQIEAITESEARNLALQTLVIKGHDVYFVDFGGPFGFSCLVFADGHYIHYANDYQLHHANEAKENLKETYIKKLENILFTEEELTAPLRDYQEYTRKLDYLSNKYPQRRDNISIWFCGSPEEKKARQKALEGKIFSPVALAYFSASDKDFVDHMHSLYTALKARQAEAEKDFEYIRSAFLYEMFNHEYGINWQGDYDVLSCFGTITYREDGLSCYFKELGFTPDQIKAYYFAQAAYYDQTRDAM